MADVAGLELTKEDVDRLSNPLIGAVILFARNYASPAQLKQLTESIHALRDPALPIAVDHEGGRVQRFRDGFTTIPPMRSLGHVYQVSPHQAVDTARDVGYIIGAELSAHGVDFSFVPVLDLDWGESAVIGHRAFHRDPEIVSELAGGLVAGLREAGVASCGKHYPGHGYVRADSHHEIPRDPRPYAQIAADDMIPFRRLASHLDSIMPAHIIYEQVDTAPAGFSRAWLKLLREDIGFSGVIFSDDLTMEGAAVAGDVVARAFAAFGAGCDMVLVCNSPERCDELLRGLERAEFSASPQLSDRVSVMRARQTNRALQSDERYAIARAALAALKLQ
jgi:beta-N-acetylhexosaminidase